MLVINCSRSNARAILIMAFTILICKVLRTKYSYSPVSSLCSFLYSRRVQIAECNANTRHTALVLSRPKSHCPEPAGWGTAEGK